MVQLHGSGCTTRSSQWFFYTSVALRVGLAVLTFDKRGCGESTGVYRPSTVARSAALFDQLASDGAAAHAWLLRQDGIDPDRVGFIGGSQAGWIMPLAAEKAEATRFIISGCGPTVSRGEEEEHGRVLGRGRSLAEADAAIVDYAGPRGYDPRALLRRLDTPILWMFGERDEVIPTRASLDEFDRLHAEGHRQYAVHLFADTDHSFRTSTGQGVLLEPVIQAWLRQEGILR